MSVFKAYDVRGVYPHELNEDIAHRVGNAFARFIRSDTIIVARDVRTSSPALAQALIKGILDAGANVTDLGMCTTPQLSYAAQDTPAVMITASHNPKQHNGIKFYKKGGEPIGRDNGLDTIERLSSAPRTKKRGKQSRKNNAPAYISHLSTLAGHLSPDLRIVIDASNGSAGLLLPKLTTALKLTHVKKLYWTPNGTFPNHPPDPLRAQSTTAAKNAVKKHHAHFGAVIDADADRIVFIDDKGAVMRAEHALILFARLHRQPRVVSDLRMGWILHEELRKLGTTPIRSKVGRTHVYSAMKTHRAHVGGELSGHYYFRDNHYADDALLALLYMARIVSNGTVLSESVRSMTRYANSGELNFRAPNPQERITKLYNVMLAKFKGGTIDFLDGLSAEFKDWRFNVRASNTQDILRVIVEAKDDRILDKRVRLLHKLIRAR